MGQLCLESVATLNLFLAWNAVFLIPAYPWTAAVLIILQKHAPYFNEQPLVIYPVLAIRPPLPGVISAPGYFHLQTPVKHLL